jgi:hypothetical protein
VLDVADGLNRTVVIECNVSLELLTTPGAELTWAPTGAFLLRDDSGVGVVGRDGQVLAVDDPRSAIHPLVIRRPPLVAGTGGRVHQLGTVTFGCDGDLNWSPRTTTTCGRLLRHPQPLEVGAVPAGAVFCSRCLPPHPQLGAILLGVESPGRPEATIGSPGPWAWPSTVEVVSLPLRAAYRVELDAPGQAQSVTVSSLEGHLRAGVAGRYVSAAVRVATGAVGLIRDGGEVRTLHPGEVRAAIGWGGRRSREEWRADRRSDRLDRWRRALQLADEGVAGRDAAAALGYSYGYYRVLLCQARKARSEGLI